MRIRRQGERNLSSLSRAGASEFAVLLSHHPLPNHLHHSSPRFDNKAQKEIKFLLPNIARATRSSKKPHFLTDDAGEKKKRKKGSTRGVVKTAGRPIGEESLLLERGLDYVRDGHE